MPRNSDTAPRVLGVAMSPAENGNRWFAKFGELNATINVERVEESGKRRHDWWITTLDHSMLREGSTNKGQQAAASAAEAWLVSRAEPVDEGEVER